MDGISITKALPFDRYRALDAVHFGTLKHLDVSPLHYRHALSRPDVETDAMRLGRIVHAMILTGSLPDDMAAFDGKARRGKAWSAFVAEHEGKSVVRKVDLQVASAMHAAVMRYAPARDLLRRGDAEVTVQWRSHGLRCKGRLDFFTGEQIVEVKTTRSIDPRIFMRECAARAYHSQIAYYSAGYEAATGASPPVLPALIAIESAPPYDVAVYRVGFDALEAGARKVEAWMERLRACTASDYWPGVAFGGVMDLRLPEWATTVGDDVHLEGIGG